MSYRYIGDIKFEMSNDSGEGKCRIFYNADSDKYSGSYSINTALTKTYAPSNMWVECADWAEIERRYQENGSKKSGTHCRWEVEMTPSNGMQTKTKETDMSRKNYHEVTPENRLDAMKELLKRGRIFVDGDDTTRENATYATLYALLEVDMVNERNGWFSLSSRGQQYAEQTGLIQFSDFTELKLEA